MYDTDHRSPLFTNKESDCEKYADPKCSSGISKHRKRSIFKLRHPRHQCGNVANAWDEIPNCEEPLAYLLEP